MSNPLIMLLLINSVSYPFVQLPYTNFNTEYCRLSGCAQNGSVVVNASGAPVTSSMPSSNVSDLNTSLFTSYGCTIDTDSCVVASAASSWTRPRPFLTGLLVVVAAINLMRL